MKKRLRSLICLLLVLLTSAGGVSCTQRDPEVIPVMPPAPEPTASTTAAPTVEPVTPTATPSIEPSTEPAVTPTVEPTATPAVTPTPTPVPGIPTSVDEAISMYEGYGLGYTPIDRGQLEPLSPIEPPRYTLGEDGVYHSSSSTGDNEAVIMFTGDIMCQARQQLACKTGSTYNFNGCFEYMRSLFSKADLVVGNLESTFCPTAPYMSEQNYVDGSPNLNAPATFIDGLRYAGYDLVLTANNHACDAGVRGIYDTLDLVEKYGLAHTGTFRNPEECRYVIMDVEGIKVGFMGYTTYFNHKEDRLNKAGREALLNPYDPERVASDVKKVREAGAEYVVVYIHWGVEYMTDPGLVVQIPLELDISGETYSFSVPLNRQLRYAQEIADAGVDYIIGSHSHTVQPYDIITAKDGRQVPVIYSMGNFLSHQKRDITKDTIVLRIILKRDPTGKVVLVKEGYVPCRMLVSYKGRNYTLLPITYPYNQGNTSPEFAPAYYRITKAVGKKLEIMGAA